jgi:hypothetical protein
LYASPPPIRLGPTLPCALPGLEVTDVCCSNDAAADREHAALAAKIEQLPRLVNEDADLVRRGAWIDLQFQIGLGPVPYYVTVTSGRISAFERGPILMRSSRFQINATAKPGAISGSPSRSPAGTTCWR